MYGQKNKREDKIPKRKETINMTNKYELNAMELELVAGGRQQVGLHAPQTIKLVTTVVNKVRDIIKNIFG